MFGVDTDATAADSGFEAVYVTEDGAEHRVSLAALAGDSHSLVDQNLEQLVHSPAAFIAVAELVGFATRPWAHARCPLR